MALNFNQYANEGNAFLNEYAKKINMPDDTDKAGRILSSVLHGLREIIPVEESLQLISQFPMFLKAVYVNRWTLGEKEKVKNMTEFIDLIRELNGVTGMYDFGSEEIAENYIKTTFMVLRKYISLGELEDIRTVLPKELKSIVYQNMMFQ
ncbi:MAG: DUF2267 domain-containing protein [Lutibacter sp.]|nr:DUF2267 domain-containing protein [Lutibacter sp.]MDT8417391.1 DUF2267 domain-containing protein [Lutibacter sp.]